MIELQLDENLYNVIKVIDCKVNSSLHSKVVSFEGIFTKAEGSRVINYIASPRSPKMYFELRFYFSGKVLSFTATLLGINTSYENGNTKIRLDFVFDSLSDGDQIQMVDIGKDTFIE